MFRVNPPPAFLLLLLSLVYYIVMPALAFLSVFAVSLVSLVGLFALSLSPIRLRKTLFALISLSVGALLGDVFLHILPQIFEADGNLTLSMSLIFIGFLIFFILEKFLLWHHGHEGEVHDEQSDLGHEHGTKHIGYLNIVSDGLHNLIDGLVIGGSYFVSTEVGIATTIAVVLHEIPQEIGDFGLLLHVGFSRAQALLANFFSALVAFLGLFIAILLGTGGGNIIVYILPLAAGGFLYIAGSDLVPELHKTSDVHKSVIQLLAIMLGFALMGLLLLIE